jgi:hypothetical protein
MNEGDWFKPNMVHMSYDGHAKDWWVRPKWEYIRFLAWARCDVFVAQWICHPEGCGLL